VPLALVGCACLNVVSVCIFVFFCFPLIQPLAARNLINELLLFIITVFLSRQDETKVSLCKRRGWPLEHSGNSVTSSRPDDQSSTLDTSTVCRVVVPVAAPVKGLATAATLVVEQMRDAIAPSDLKATGSGRGDDGTALLEADRRINI